MVNLAADGFMARPFRRSCGIHVLYDRPAKGALEMDEARFWACIERNLGNADAVAAELKSLPAVEIESWQGLYYDHHNALNRWDLWGAAHLIMGGCAGEPGCSQDGFFYFRAWVIGKGRATYAAAIAEPDSLGRYVTAEDLAELCWNEPLNYAAEKAFREAFGEYKRLNRNSNELAPLGERWDEERLPDMFPQLAAWYLRIRSAKGQCETDSIKEIVGQAHAAWELKELEVAAELFRKAAAAEGRAAARRAAFASADRSFSYAIRSAICLWDCGRHTEARPVLEQALTFDWTSARLYSDRHMTEWAFARLLVERVADQDRPGFLSLWQRATLRGEQLALPFPSILQKTLLNACMSLTSVEGCQQIIGLINPKQLRRDHELRLLHSQALALCQRGQSNL